VCVCVSEVLGWFRASSMVFIDQREIGYLPKPRHLERCMYDDDDDDDDDDNDDGDVDDVDDVDVDDDVNDDG
jgi:hypothetical protein